MNQESTMVAVATPVANPFQIGSTKQYVYQPAAWRENPNRLSWKSEFNTLTDAINAIANGNSDEQTFLTGSKKEFNGYFHEFLMMLPEDRRQWHNCNACRGFFRKYGRLVYIELDGTQRAYLWDETKVPEVYREAVAWLRNKVETSPIRQVGGAERNMGEQPDGEYTHMHVAHTKFLLEDVVKSVDQNKHIFDILQTNLNRWDEVAVRVLLGVMESDHELKTRQSHVNWLASFSSLLTRTRATKHHTKRANLMWTYIAAHPVWAEKLNGSALEVLLDAFVPGADKEDMNIAKRAFLKNTDARNYMRPTEKPKTGAMDAARKLIAELDLESALQRRYLRVDEIKHWYWQPAKAVMGEAKPASLLDLVDTRDAKAMQAKGLEVVGGNITWMRFVETVLPKAQSIKLVTEARMLPISCFLTQADDTANPILKYDNAFDRNPVHAYGCADGRDPRHVSIPLNGMVEVIGIVPGPDQFNMTTPPPGGFEQYNLVLENSKETMEVGVCLFPEILRHELYPVRSVMEELSNKVTAANRDDSFAALTFLGSPHPYNIRLVVKDAAGNSVSYRIDRFV